MTKKQKEILIKEYLKMNHWKWCDGLFPKPNGFDELPEWDVDRWTVSKSKMITPVMDYITLKVGARALSWGHWKYNLQRTYLQWLYWYVFKSRSQFKKLHRETLGDRILFDINGDSYTF